MSYLFNKMCQWLIANYTVAYIGNTCPTPSGYIYIYIYFLHSIREMALSTYLQLHLYDCVRRSTALWLHQSPGKPLRRRKARVCHCQLWPALALYWHDYLLDMKCHVQTNTTWLNKRLMFEIRCTADRWAISHCSLPKSRNIYFIVIQALPVRCGHDESHGEATWATIITPVGEWTAHFQRSVPSSRRRQRHSDSRGETFRWEYKLVE